jgi:hypothetical protein
MGRSCWCGAGEPGRDYECRCQESFYYACAAGFVPDTPRWQSRADQMIAKAEKDVLRERALRAEAEVRELRETVGELLDRLGLKCQMCGREMVIAGDGDNRDCGGDCWGCIRAVEEAL